MDANAPKAAGIDVDTLWRSARERGLPETGLLVVVSVARQFAFLLERGHVVDTMAVSTAIRGTGCEEGSYKTPTGWHEVAEWIGDGEPEGRVFKERKPTGERMGAASGGDRDAILTRILRLRGLEPGVNCGAGLDSFDRFIYLHGTNREDLLGKPASRGCIRLASRDVVRLHDRTRDRTTLCWIG